MPGITENISRIEVSLAKKLCSLGRQKDDCLLVAVTKTHDAETVKQAVLNGITHFGENKVQEAIVKVPALQIMLGDSHPFPSFHFIGHLQSNKVKALLRLSPWLIHSVDSYDLAAVIDKYTGERIQDILIQVNTSGESSKSGMSPDRAKDEILRIAELKRLRIRGLMTVGLLGEAPEEARPGFRELKQLFDEIADIGDQRLEMRYLSMGMSDDHMVALEEGANLVRLGSAIFGARNYGGTP